VDFGDVEVGAGVLDAGVVPAADDGEGLPGEVTEAVFDVGKAEPG
jgi:hypothetical protein